MTKKRQVISIAICVASILVLFGSCQKKEAAAGPGDAPKQVTLSFFTREPQLAAVYDRINEAWYKKNPNVRIEMVHIPDNDYDVKVDTTILAGDALDICFFNNFPLYSVRAVQGEFASLDSYLAGEGIKFNDIYSIGATVDDGKIYGLPGDIKFSFVWINKNDLDKAGLPVPPLDWTWDDYREYAKKLTYGTGPNKHYGSMWFTWDHFNLWIPYNKMDGNPYLNPNGGHNLTNPAFVESLKLRYDLEQVDKTQIPMAEIFAMQLDYRSVFLSGRASMTITNTNMTPQIAQITQFPHDFVTCFAPLPKPKDGRNGYTYADNRFYSIGQGSKNPQAAYDYLRFFTTEGIPLKNVTFTAEKVQKISRNTMAESMIADNPSLFDLPSLQAVFSNPDLHENIWTYVPSYTTEVFTIYRAEADKAINGEISFDQAIKNTIPQVESVLKREANKK
ncbi:ABC transporter substrate-binding protein [Spirochaetia bacterium]|nr:ABC transporter substrate-binding protein [Spirochaetia bacterium]